MRETLFLEALYSWDEFWQSIETGWALFGDPRHFKRDELVKWANERVPALHGGSFAQPMPVAGLVHRGEQDIARLYGGQVLRYWAICDHSYRVMDWLGLEDSDSFVWWLFAYVGGNMRKFLPFIRNRKPGAVDYLIRQLTPVKLLVARMSKDKLPQVHSEACPPEEYDPLSKTLFKSSQQAKYPRFDPELLSRKYREGLMPEPLDKRTIRQRKSILRFWGEEYDSDKELAEQRASVGAQIEKTLKHPIYKLIHMAKFRTTSSAGDRLHRIAELTRECHEGQIGIDVLLQWAWENERNEYLRQKLSLANKGSTRFTEIRCEVANKIYRQVHGWFRRRGWRMPSPPDDWRIKIIEV
jgi:hypothetical protein